MAQQRKIAIVDKERLIHCFEQDGDYVALSANLGIKEKTARSIVRRHNLQLHQGPHGGHKAKVITNEIGESLIEFVNENPLITLNVMQAFLSSLCGVNVSLSCISKWLDGQLITLKKTREVIAERNSLRVKDLRCTYAQWIIEGDVTPEECIYIDESGFNVWIKRNYGRSSSGKRCFTVCNGQRGRNISLCMAIGLNGVLHWKLINDSFNRERFTEFLMELSEMLAGTRFHFVVDNCSIHRDVQLDNEEHSLVYLPPYSPFLNPIEAAFSALKAEVKSRWNAPGFNRGYTYPQNRDALMTIINDSLHVITANNCRAFYRHSSTFMAKCLQKLDILGD
jgi:transposase